MLQQFGPLFGRTLLALIFIFSGFHKLTGFDGTAGYMASHGLPMPQVLLVATIVIELIGGLMILIGWQARIAAAAIFLFLIPATLVFHAFWNVNPADAMLLQNQMNHFMKNVAIMGGMLYIVTHGSGPFSLQKSR
ncbi:MAG: DoxX family protein [Burkholderiales bacterium]|nr:DoxX family protein [Burkholderiales bacterium]